MKGWERTGIQDAVERGSEANLDPFDDINPIGEVDEGSDNDCETPIKSTDKKCISYDVYDEDDQDDSEYEDGDDNKFDRFHSKHDGKCKM